MAFASTLSVGPIRAGRPRHKQLQSRGGVMVEGGWGGASCGMSRKAQLVLTLLKVCHRNFNHFYLNPCKSAPAGVAVHV